jgi:hypothetical protein
MKESSMGCLRVGRLSKTPLVNVESNNGKEIC